MVGQRRPDADGSSVLPAAVAEPITSVLDGMRQSAASVGLIAIALLLINGSSFFTNMASVFNRAYHVQGRNFVVERLIALGMLIVTAAMLILSTFAAGLSGFVSSMPGVLPVGPLLGQGGLVGVQPRRTSPAHSCRRCCCWS